MWTFKSHREQCVPVICMWGPPSETYTVSSAMLWSTTEHKSVRTLMRARSPYSHSVREALTARRGGAKQITEQLNGKAHRRWCHRALVPSMFLSRGSLMSKIRFQDRFAVRCLELISCFLNPRGPYHETTGPGHKLLSLLNNWGLWHIVSW